MAIPQSPPPPPPPNRESDGLNENDFRIKSNAFIDWMYDYFTDSWTTIMEWVDSTLSTIQDTADSVEEDKTNVAENKAIVEAIKDDVTTIKNDIENYSIPEEATYSFSALDESMAELWNKIHINTADNSKILIQGVNK